MSRAIARRHVRVDLIRKRDETDGVLLSIQKVRQ
jgi:hypothetical protein